MSQTLLAVLLVTSSAKGSSLVYRWPPNPSASPRLSRPLPHDSSSPSNLDNPWRASHFSDNPTEKDLERPEISEFDSSYRWKKPASTTSVTQQESSSSSKNGSYSENEGPMVKDEYEHIFGYSSEFLANLLCPNRSMCHQKFELVVDDLAFIGHPVCAEKDDIWRFRPEKLKPGARGRESRNRQSPGNDKSASPDRSSAEKPAGFHSAWLHTFHFVLVLDLPDPSSSASGNISKYFDVIYEQIAFPVTAVLFQEQVLSNFVEMECDTLGSLKESCVSKGSLTL